MQPAFVMGSLVDGLAHPGQPAADIVDGDVDVPHPDRAGGLAGERNRCAQGGLDDSQEGETRAVPAAGSAADSAQLAIDLGIAAQVLECDVSCPGRASPALGCGAPTVTWAGAGTMTGGVAAGSRRRARQASRTLPACS